MFDQVFIIFEQIWSDDSHFFKVEFNLPQDLKYLQNVVENSSILTVIPKPISAFPNYLIKQLSWMDNYVSIACLYDLVTKGINSKTLTGIPLEFYG